MLHFLDQNYSENERCEILLQVKIILLFYIGNTL